MAANSTRSTHPALAGTARLSKLTGLEFLQALIDGEIPAPPMARTLGFRLHEVEHGRALFVGAPSIDYYNPIGSVHGGWAATLLDSCMGCAVHSTLPAGAAYTTLEFKIDLIRAITEKTGEVTAEGTVVRVGKRVGLAEGVLRDINGELLARGSTTCLILMH
ncbi:MAG: PaaI family thioesterase [Gammaproteobacteria bacterium]